MTDTSVRAFTKARCVLGALLAVLMASPPGTLVLAQTVTTNVTKTAGSSTLVQTLGTARNIRGGDVASSGAGTNLFHSFQDFTIGAGDSVVFTNLTGLGNIHIADPGGVSNIISRVTGVNPSNIFGNINSSGAFPNASLFLINPHGIVFGATASLNVGGSVHFSTADYIRMTDGALFHADLAKSSTLSSAAVTAFGFLGPNPPNAILIQGTLQVPIGKTISLVGGDLTIEGIEGNVSVSGSTANVNLISLGQPGVITPTTPAEVVLNASGPPTITNFSTMGNILLSQGASVNAGGLALVASSTGSGTVVIRGGQLTVDSGASIDTTYFGSVVGQAAAPISIDINTTQGVTLQNDGEIRADSHTNKAGDISIVTGGALQLNGGRIQAYGLREGGASNVTINADSVSITGTAAQVGQIVTNAAGSGSAGNTTITARIVDIGAHGGIGAAASSAGSLGPNPGTGNGGTITINASQQVTLHDGGELTSTSVAGGNAGSVIVGAPSIIVSSGGLINSQAESTGAAGFVHLTGQTVQLTGVGTELSTRTLGSAPGGDLQVDANLLSITNGASIIASTTGTGSAGNITLNVDTFRSNTDSLGNPLAGNRVAISSESTLATAAAGQAGTITIRGAGSTDALPLPASALTLYNTDLTTQIMGGTAATAPASISLTGQQIAMSGGTQLRVDTGADAPAGSITMRANTLTADNVTILSSTNGTGAAGSITIRGGPGLNDPLAATSVTIKNDALVRSDTFASGDAGSITVTANELNLQTGANLQGVTQGSGNAGNVMLNVGTLRSNVNPDLSPIAGAQTVLISTESRAVGAAGTVTIRGVAGQANPNAPAQLVALNNTTVSTEVGQIAAVNAPPGHIAVTADTVNLTGDTQITASTSGAASAGNITFNTGSLTANNGALISSTNTTASGNGSGNAGSVTIQGLTGTGSSAASVTINNATVTTSTGIAATAGNAPATISMATNNLSLTAGAQIKADTSGGARAGDIILATGTTSVGSGANISTSSTSTGAGNAGSISITASTLTVDGAGSAISAQTQGAGNAGSVTANANVLALSNGASLASNSLSTSPTAGHAGAITLQGLAGPGSTAQNVNFSGSATLNTAIAGGTNVTAPATITVAANNMVMTTGAQIKADTSGGARAGDIILNAGTTSLQSGAKISTISTSTNPLNAGTAGNIALTSASDIMLTDSSITTQAAQASGGNIKLTAPGIVLLDNSKITSSVNGPAGSNGGNISIDPQFVILLNGSQILAQAVGGNGGNITIVTNTFLDEPGTLIDASSSLGISGEIVIQSPIQNLAGAITPLPQNLVSLASLYGQHCAAQKGGQFSSFVQGQRDGLPTQPGDFISSPLGPELFSPQLRSEEPNPVNLAAARLGLNDSMSFSRTALSLTSGCRS